MPGAGAAAAAEIDREAAAAAQDMRCETEESKRVPVFSRIPKEGVPRRKVLEYLAALATMDAKTEQGTVFAYVYEWGEKEKKVRSSGLALLTSFSPFLDRHSMISS